MIHRVSRARDPDVKQAPLFFEISGDRVAGPCGLDALVRHGALFGPDHEDLVPLEALRGVHRGQGDLALDADRRGVRLLGLGVSGFGGEESRQLDLFE